MPGGKELGIVCCFLCSKREYSDSSLFIFPMDRPTCIGRVRVRVSKERDRTEYVKIDAWKKTLFFLFAPLAEKRNFGRPFVKSRR